ncbi:MAG TPA: ZIP family metal transporter [Gemmatimonadaceae bacterium]|nr:ZIP family metal transporter [Gemmatimonadaceae bacterium]
MTPEITYAMLAAAGNLLGAAAVAWRARWSVRALEAMVALAAGFMITASLTDIFPEAIRRGGHTAAVVALVGYLLVHLAQHTLAPHFHFGEETHQVSEVVGFSALLGLLVHTFVDGVAIASGFHVSAELGLLVFAAIILHKLPEGLAISSLFLAAGAPRRVAIYAALALGVATVAGAASTGTFPLLQRHGLALSAGVTLYVGASNLVPEFQAKRGLRLPAAFFLGGALYFLARAAIGL